MRLALSNYEFPEPVVDQTPTLQPKFGGSFFTNRGKIARTANDAKGRDRQPVVTIATDATSNSQSPSYRVSDLPLFAPSALHEIYVDQGNVWINLVPYSFNWVAKIADLKANALVRSAEFWLARMGNQDADAFSLAELIRIVDNLLETERWPVIDAFLSRVCPDALKPQYCLTLLISTFVFKSKLTARKGLYSRFADHLRLIGAPEDFLEGLD